MAHCADLPPPGIVYPTIPTRGPPRAPWLFCKTFCAKTHEVGRCGLRMTPCATL